MSNIKFVQLGESIDYTPSGDVGPGVATTAAGLLGVTRHNIPANTLGALHISPEIYELVKDSSSFTAGDNVYLTLSTQVAKSGTSGAVLFGPAINDAGSGAGTVLARLKVQG